MDTINCKVCSTLIYIQDSSLGYCKDCRIKRLKMGILFVIESINWQKMSSNLNISSEHFINTLKSYLNE